MHNRYLAIPIPDNVSAECFLIDLVDGQVNVDECLIFDRMAEKKIICKDDPMSTFAREERLIEWAQEDISKDLAKYFQSTVEFAPNITDYDNRNIIVTGSGYILSGKIKRKGE